MSEHLFRAHRITHPFSAYPTGEGDTPETGVEPGEVVHVLAISTGPLPEDTNVEFTRGNGRSWTALFDTGDPFVAPFKLIDEAG